MTEPRGRRRSAAGGEDVISALQATLDREECRRIALRRAGASMAALTLVLAIAAAVLLHGNASAADRAKAARSPEPAPVPSGLATAAPPAEQPQVEARASAPRAPAERKRRSMVKKPPEKKLEAAKPAAPKPEAQRLRIAIGSQGYEPSVVRASVGRPIVLSIGRGEGCAAGFLIPKLGVEKDNSTGPVTVKLGRVPAGNYQFSCGMGMVTGTLLVK